MMRKRIAMFLLLLLLCVPLLGHAVHADQESTLQLIEKPFPGTETVLRLLGESERDLRWICAADDEQLIGLCPAGTLKKTFFLYDEKSGVASWLPITDESIEELKTSMPKFDPTMFIRFGNPMYPPNIAPSEDGRYLLASTMDNYCILFDLEEKCTHWVGPLFNITLAGNDTAYAVSILDSGIMRIRFSDRSHELVLTYDDVPTELTSLFTSLPAMTALDEQTLLLCLHKGTIKKEGEKQTLSATIRLATVRLTGGAPEIVVSEPFEMPTGTSFLQSRGKHALFLHTSLPMNPPLLLLPETDNIQDADQRLLVIEQEDAPKATLTDATSYQALCAEGDLTVQPFSAALSGDGQLAALLCINEQRDDTMLYLVDTETLELQRFELPDSARGSIMAQIRMYENDFWLVTSSQETPMLRYEIVRE